MTPLAAGRGAAARGRSPRGESEGGGRRGVDWAGALTLTLTLTLALTLTLTLRTLLAATSSYNLKDARERGMQLADTAYHTLSSGLTALGATYLAARFGAVFIDPSFPEHYKVVTQVIGYQALAALAIGATLRPDNAD